jgi:Ca2+-transporting ATPase
MMSRAMRDLGPATRAGLSEAAATERLRSEGYNDLPTAKHRGFFVIAAEVFREPMFAGDAAPGR